MYYSAYTESTVNLPRNTTDEEAEDPPTVKPGPKKASQSEHNDIRRVVIPQRWAMAETRKQMAEMAMVETR